MAKKAAVYKASGVKNPFEAQDKVYHDLIADAQREKRRWQNMALFSLLFIIAAFFVLNRAVNLQRTVPVLVTVSEWGEASYKGEVRQDGKSSQVPELAIQYQVRDFITKLRTIPTDPEILYRDISHCYEMVTGACEKKMTGELRTDDPFGKIGKQKRNVTIESVLKLSSTTYQIDWIENITVGQNAQYRVRGVVTTELLVPPEKKRVQNPLGIYIADYDMTVLR
jgi:type IV secretion system protein VirB5